jgi:hypothetical protein
MIAAEKWSKIHWPKDYEARCFICGWKSRKTLDSFIPTSPEDLMAAGIWGTTPQAAQLTKAICLNRVVSDRMKTIFGVLSHTGENALFPITANKEFASIAAKYIGKKLSFCRVCAEQTAKPLPVEAERPIDLAEAMAAEMAAATQVTIEKAWGAPAPSPTPLQKQPASIPTPKPPTDWGIDDKGWSEPVKRISIKDFLPNDNSPPEDIGWGEEPDEGDWDEEW